MKRRKHRNDYNHGKSGYVAGNVRYRRHTTKPGTKHRNRAMGRASDSSLTR